MSNIISKEEVERIAKLARLGVTDEEVQKATEDLGNILEHFSQIQKIDTKNVPTSDDVTDMKNITREDKADAECLCSAKTLLENAPETKDQQIKVKAVFN